MSANHSEELKTIVDSLDGETGKDVSGLENTILGMVFDLSPEKQKLAVERMRKLSECNTNIQSCRQKLDLLSGTAKGSTETRDLSDLLSALERKKLHIIRFAELSEGRNPKGANDSVKAETAALLKGKEGVGEIKNSDVLSLKKRGVDLAKLFLVPTKDAFGTVSNDSIAKDDEFIVNFGANPSLNEKLGAGDILPYGISKISVDGVEGVRKTSPRPGFYAKDANGKERYLPIYDKTKIAILEIGPIDATTAKSYAAADEARWKESRLSDMVEANKGEALSELAEDSGLVEEAKKAYAEVGEVKEKYARYREFRRAEFETNFGNTVRDECAKYGLPPENLVKLFEKESGFNPWIRNQSGSSAYGLGQIIDGTWAGIKRDMPGGSTLNRHDPKDQIAASAFYLSQLKNEKGCSWEDAIVYYHTGPAFSDRHVAEAMRLNPVIAKKMKGTNALAYVEAAKEYYLA
jgi:hypothetical protein